MKIIKKKAILFLILIILSNTYDALAKPAPVKDRKEAKAAAEAKAKRDKVAAAKIKRAKVAAAAKAKRDKVAAPVKAAPAEALDCGKWWGNRNSQLLMNPIRTMAINCSQYIEDCGSYDECVFDRPSDKNGCECFFNQKQSSESFSWF